MTALGIITVFLTLFVLVFYGYLAERTDRDVSFFLSVGLISLIMNLCTNAGGSFAFAWVYLAIALLFLGLGFAVSTSDSVAFYTSVGPWVKAQCADAALLGWKALSLAVFPAGLALYFVRYREEGKREFALTCGKCALWGILVWAVLLWMILGIAL